ncbi:MAG: FAD/NAD(P)-binding protein [bacterium]
MENPYVPMLARIEKITVETDAKDIKTFDIRLCDDEDRRSFRYAPGQFAEISVFGRGESPIGLASSPMDGDILQFTVMRAGSVTAALHNLYEGATVGVRGPLGNSYPMELLEGKNVVVIGGGFAFTTLRALTRYILHDENRGKFGKLTVIYGARSPGALIYKRELAEWAELSQSGGSDMELYVTVDKGDSTWKGREGFVPTVVQEVAPSSENAVAVVCGPPIMIKFTLPPLIKLGFPPERIVTSLEMRMKCGIGKCGRCNIGPKYVCKDGPVFTYKQLQELPKEY